MSEISGKYLRGETCSLSNIYGVEKLETKSGMDIVAISTNIHATLLKYTELIDDLTDRIKKLEMEGPVSGKVVEGPAGPAGPAGPMGLMGPRGQDGENGRDGPAGPRGPRASVDTLRDVKDVTYDGVEEGSVLVMRSGKWTPENILEEK